MKRALPNAYDWKMQLHWCHIHRLRRRARVLLDVGTPCTDPRLVDISNQILCHGMVVSNLWHRWKAEREQELSHSITA